MPRKIFLWIAHPAADSFNTALGDVYERAAVDAGAELRRQDLSQMEFDSDSFIGYRGGRIPLEPDLSAWQENLRWADHWMVIHPYWWGAMPGRAKAVLDRALTPGFAFRYHEEGLGWDKLMKGRTADALITSDTPPILDSLIYRRPARNVIKNQVFNFCGFKTGKVRQIGTIKTATERQRTQWLELAATMGRRAADR